MVRLNCLVEGQTEEQFVRLVLAPHLAAFDVVAAARAVEVSRTRPTVYRGGFRRQGAYEQVRKDLLNWMKEDAGDDARFTTMFDLYALPTDFPGQRDDLPPVQGLPRKVHRRLMGPLASASREPVGQRDERPDCYRRVERIEAAFARHVGGRRFIPHIQLHEFEALLLVDPQQFDWYHIEDADAAGIVRLCSLVAAVSSPELIDDGPDTTPSKRILAELPRYRKAGQGPVVAEKIGIERMRAACPHFAAWLTKLEALGSTQEPAGSR
jgi:hypothetical protein